MSKAYYHLTKPGIVYGNAFAALAGFLFASAGNINWILFAATVAGIALVIASGCVFNNVFDRHIDAKMERTKGRAIPSAQISKRHALVFGTLLGVVGVGVLFFYTTPLACVVALIGWVVYVCMYTPLKPRSSMALFVGAIAGATPPVVGYTAVTNTIDGWALFLFAALYIWQLPHFIAIAYYRFDEYTAAGVPLVIKKRPSDRAKKIAKKVFYASLVVLLVFCFGLMLQR